MRSNLNHQLIGLDKSTIKIHSATRSLGEDEFLCMKSTQDFSGVSQNLAQQTQCRDDISLKFSTNFINSDKPVNQRCHVNQMMNSHGSSIQHLKDNTILQDPGNNQSDNMNPNCVKEPVSTSLKPALKDDLGGFSKEFSNMGLYAHDQMDPNYNHRQVFRDQRPQIPSYNSNNAIYSSGVYNNCYVANRDMRVNEDQTTTDQNNNSQLSTNMTKLPYSTGHSPMCEGLYKNNDQMDYMQSESSYHYQHWGMMTSDMPEMNSAASRAVPSSTTKFVPEDSQNNTSVDGSYLTKNNYSGLISADNLPQSSNVKHQTTSTMLLTDTTYLNNTTNVNRSTNTNTNYTNATTANIQINHSANYNNINYLNAANKQNTGSISTPNIYLQNYPNNTTIAQSSFNQNYNTANMGMNAPTNYTDFVVNTADIKMLSLPELPPENNYAGQPNPNSHFNLPNVDHISLSLNSIPPNNKELKKYGLPFGIIYTPLKNLENVPVIYPKEIARCGKCLSYLNPYTQWAEPTTFVCVFCGRRRALTTDNCTDMLNDKGLAYQQPAFMSYTHSPMLQVCMTNSTYEILAPASFCKYPPKTPSYVILMDMTHICVSTGYLEIVLDCLSEKVLSLCPNKRCSIAFVGYNQFVHFFSIKNVSNDTSSTPKTIHHVISDINSIHLPFEDELLLYPAKDIEKFRHFLKTLPEAIRSFVPATAGSGQSCMANALKFSLNILEKTGGKVILFNGTPPTVGEGVVVAPEIKYESQAENITALPTATSTFYKSLGIQAYKKSISIDFFYIGFESYSPLVEMITMVNNCGGTFKYFSFSEKSSQILFENKFKAELMYHWKSNFSIDNLIAVRTSRGIDVESYYGNFMVESTGKLIVPFINENSTIAIKLEIDDVPYVYNGRVYIQVALFYTCPNGERRIRVTTIATVVLPKNNPIDVYHGANEFAIASLIAHFIYFRVQSKTKLSHIQEATINSCKQIVTEFYETIKTRFDGRNLLMHTNLQHLLCFVHSLLYHPSLSEITTCMSIDNRLSVLEFYKTSSIRDLIGRLYPKLYPLNNLEYYTFEELIDPSDPHKFIYTLHPSAQFMYQQCAYLLDSGFASFILIPKGISTNFIKMIFNCENFDDLPHHTVGLPSYSNDLSFKLRQFVNYVVNKDKARSYPYFNTVIFKVNANSICSFYNHLPFDRRPNKLASLNEFYAKIKEEILNK